MVTGFASYPEVNALLDMLLVGVRSVLGPQLVGLYLGGSLATGDFDQESDIDFVVVTRAEIAQGDDLFAALKAMHARVAQVDSHWATELEGSYLSPNALRRFDPAHSLYPHIERGPGRSLELEWHGSDWIIQCHVLREHGITLAGPPPQTLIDLVKPEELRQAAKATLSEWWAPMLDDPVRLNDRGYQSYAVLTMCRALYTIQNGAVASKQVAARWAKETLGARRARLIGRAWVGRQNPRSAALPDDVTETLELIRYVIECSRLVGASCIATVV